MKDFFKFTLATICGIILLIMVTGFIFTVTIIGMAVSSSTTTDVKDNSVFVLKLDGTVNERAESDPLSELFRLSDIENMGLDDILQSIQKAKENKDIKGIYLEGGLTVFDSPATAQQIHDALADFKQSGKWIIAFSDNYLQTNYYVASVADSIFLNKTGMIDLKGLGGKSEYWTGFYEKLGIEYQPVRVGKYKSYVESQTRKDMSAEDREQRTAHLQGIWQHMLKDIADSRKLTAQNLDQMVSDSIMAFANPTYYVDAKLVDALIYPDEIKKIIKGKLGIDANDNINQLLLSDMINVESKKKEEGEEIAIYYAYGEIVDQPLTGLGASHTIVGSETVEDLQELADDDDVKAVVLRVNSGGGSAVASEQIWHAVENLKAKKPVVVSMGGMAASGGYMISSGANYIFAEPTTITGSIGIFGLIPNVSVLATDKLGFTFDGVKTNKYTDYEENLVLAKENSQELAFLQSYVNRGYETFLEIVGKGRTMKRDEVDSIAQGRVWLATDALPIHLIDWIGSLDDAIKKAAELAKIGEYHTAVYPGQEDWLESFVNQQEDKGSYLDSELRSLLGEMYEPIMQIRLDKQRNRLQTRLPYNMTVQ